MTTVKLCLGYHNMYHIGMNFVACAGSGVTVR